MHFFSKGRIQRTSFHLNTFHLSNAFLSCYLQWNGLLKESFFCPDSLLPLNGCYIFYIIFSSFIVLDFYNSFSLFLSSLSFFFFLVLLMVLHRSIDAINKLKKSIVLIIIIFRLQSEKKHERNRKIERAGTWEK